jgi:hypothetical protein
MIQRFNKNSPWETWDCETDHKLKMQKIVAWLDQLLSNTNYEQHILDIHQQCHSRLIKNKQRYHSPEFLDVLSRQLHLEP